MQIHKRSRALRRLFRHLKDHHFRAEIHMSYFIPLAYAFLSDHSYSKHANIQDAVVDLLGAICKQLPWHFYLQQLRFYLYLLPKKVEVQRQLVRFETDLLYCFLLNESVCFIISFCFVSSATAMKTFRCIMISDVLNIHICIWPIMAKFE